MQRTAARGERDKKEEGGWEDKYKWTDDDGLLLPPGYIARAAAGDRQGKRRFLNSDCHFNNATSSVSPVSYYSEQIDSIIQAEVLKMGIGEGDNPPVQRSHP